MNTPPPVPPKDTPRKGHCMAAINGTAQPSNGSKRKREPVESIVGQHGAPDTITSESDAVVDHLPKRGRADASLSYEEEFERETAATALTAKGLRRTKKVGNFAVGRQSRFQEGSLNDKPSETPPSSFVDRADSGIYLQHEQQLSDYHREQDSDVQATESADASDVTDKNRQTGRDSFANSGTSKRDQGSSFFRLSRSFAASFHPVTLWNKLWSESKEDLVREDMHEISNREALKREAERRYTQMKLTGQFEPYAQSSQAATQDHRDENSRPHGEYLTEETQFGTLKPAKRLKTRVSFKRPSLSSLRGAIKTNSSEVMLPALDGRDSSLSLSPVKTDADYHYLSQSPSKSDLRRQHKLSKKVSDLEAKLQQARRELDEALYEASPMPRLHGQHGSFSATGVSQRSKFVPGVLPSLPSERLLIPDTYRDMQFQPKIDEAISEPEGQETIKASRHKQHPPRVSSLFYGHLTGSVPELSSNDSQSNHGHAKSSEDLGTTTSAPVPAISIPAKSPRRRKRKSVGKTDDVAFQPSPSTGNSEGEESSDPIQRKRKRTSSAVPAPSPESKRSKLEATSVQESIVENEETLAASQSGLVPSARSSIDSQAHSLEPVYEEDEEVIPEPSTVDEVQHNAEIDALSVPVPEHPSKKRKVIQDTPEELMLTRAAAAAQQNRARPSTGKRTRQGTFEWPDDVF